MQLATDILHEIRFHSELDNSKKVSLLINKEYLKTSRIRKNGLETVPNEWIKNVKKVIWENIQTNEEYIEPNQETFQKNSEGWLKSYVNNIAIDTANLEELWLRPSEGYLYKMLSKSGNDEDKARLEKLKNSEGFSYRGIGNETKLRKQKRLEKLQKSIDKDKVVIFLRRQNRVYKELQKKLNNKYKGIKQFVSDHVWSSCGYIEPGVKSSNSWLSVIQAMETIRRMPDLGLKGNAISKREIAFCLDGYDFKHALAAMYSNPNRIERNYGKPETEGIETFEFAYTGLTDLELANIVRNKNWFELLTFYRTGENGEPENLTKEQVAKEYGIKYIGDLMKERIN